MGVNCYKDIATLSRLYHSTHTITSEGHGNLWILMQIFYNVGLANYRSMLRVLEVQVADIWDMPLPDSVIHELKQVDHVLRSVFAQNPLHIPHAAHILWFASSAAVFLDLIWGAFLLKRTTVFNRHRELLESLEHGINVAITISARQVLENTPNTLQIFAYLAVHSHNTIAQESHDMVDICTTTDITDDTSYRDSYDRKM